MAISFNTIPTNLRPPIFYAEIDASRAALFQENARALLIGQRTAAGEGAAHEPVIIGSPEQARRLFGEGSILARMVEAFRRNNGFTELWAVAVDDDPAAAAASGTLTVTGNAIAPGTLSIYVAGQRIAVPVAAGQTPAQIAEEIKRTFDKVGDLPVTSTFAGAVVTLTARNKGALGNDIDLRLNHAGAPGGEAFPPDVTVTATAMAGGTGAPSLAAALAALSDSPFDFIGVPYTDSGALDALKELMDDQTGRWSPFKQIYGHVFAARLGKVEDDGPKIGLVTFGQSRNDQHASVLGYHGSPTPPWEVAAMFTAQAARSLAGDPARPLQTLPLVGMLAPKIPDQFTLSQRNSLLYAGVSTCTYARGAAQIERAISTYQVNQFGQPDPSYLDVTTLATLWRIVREMRQVVTSKFARVKLANNGTRFGPGQAIVTPAMVRGELIGLYSRLEGLGLVENMAAFKASLVVERNASDPSRLDVLLPPDLVNGLIVFAAKVQFRLQFAG
jgi:phage tail sheath gpL-like